MARNDPQVNLRMPADLKGRLDKAAQESKRSLTAEIVARLEATFVREDNAGGIKFDLNRLPDNESKRLVELLTEAAIMVVKANPEQATKARESHSNTVNALIDAVLDEHDDEVGRRKKRTPADE